MGFLNTVREKHQISNDVEKPKSVDEAKFENEINELKKQNSQNTDPKNNVHTIYQNEEESSPLKDKVSASYDKIRIKQQEESEEEKNPLEESHRIIHGETETRLYTIMDDILDKIKRSKSVGLGQLIRDLNIEKELVNYWLNILEKNGYINITYSLNIFADPIIKYTGKHIEKKDIKLPANKVLLDSYEVVSDHIVAKINLWTTKSNDVPIYQIMVPEIGEGTHALMLEIIERISEEFDIDVEELRDKTKRKKLTVRFFDFTRKLLAAKLPKVSEEFLDILTGTILHNMYGLGEMEILMADNWIEEISINGSKAPVSVYHKRFNWVKTTIMMKNEEEVYNFASRIGRNVGRQINSLNPIMDAHLSTGDRVAATLFPISTSGNTITIRRFARNPWTIVNLIDPKVRTMSAEVGALLWLAMQYELNVMVAGGTASGKTSALNSITCMIPPKQRVISIEDTREIFLPKDLHWNWVPMNTRQPNPEGKGQITMLDLMVASLRMRPDRIIVGEVRRKEQAETMFETMHTGHSCYATIHADTVEQVMRRLLEPPISIPKTELGALHLVMIQYRDRRKGARRTLEIAEIISSDGGDEKDVELNYLYRWRPRTDTFEKVNESVRLVQDLNLHTGMTHEEIKNDLKKKQKILEWLSEHQIKDVDKVGKIMKIYYSTPKTIEEAAQNNEDPNRIILG